MDNINLTIKQRKFLSAYALTGSKPAAARAALCSRTNHYAWMSNPTYEAAFNQAQEQAIEQLEADVRRRAEEGEPEILMYQGQPVLEPLYDEKGEVVRDKRTGKVKLSNRPMVVMRKSDILAMFLLKSMRPERYRDNSQVQLASVGGGPLEIKVSFVNPPTPTP